MVRKLLIMFCLCLIPLSSLADDWKHVKEKKGVNVYTQKTEGKKLLGVKATYIFDAKPREVYDVINDLDNYKNFMPHTKESKLLGKKDNDSIFYTIIDAPLISKRDYTLLLKSEFDADDIKGKIKVTWKEANELGPKEKEGYVRVVMNKGHWILTPKGEKTDVEYYFFIDPGGSVASWIVNTANKTSIPDIIFAVEKKVKENREKVKLQKEEKS